jgi:DNA-binding CsgD family transcriptional regulator
VPAIEALVLALYHRAQEAPFERFQEQALLEVKAYLPFDIARWGTGNFDTQGLVFHAPCLFNDSPESLVDYAPLRDHDQVAFHCAAHPGETLNCHLPGRSQHSSALQEYARRYRHEQGLITGFVNSASGVVASISLYRAYERCAFTETERLHMQLLFPHLLEALKICQRLEAERLRQIDDGCNWSIAVVDPGGAFCFAEATFLALMKAEWSNASTHALPIELLRTLQGTPHRAVYGRSIVVAPFPTKTLIFLRARLREPIDSLTRREREIAELIAGGLTHKEIANTLKIAPATVNNHLRAIHERIGARNNAELASRLRLVRA